jgi:integrase
MLRNHPKLYYRPPKRGMFLMANRGKIRYRRDRNIWYVDIYWQGGRHYFSKYLGIVPCQTKDLARRLRDQINTEIDQGIFNPDRHKKATPLHLMQYAETWLNTLNVEDSTLHDYRNSLFNHILPILGDEFLPDINSDKLKKLQKSINRAPKGKYNVMSCLKKLLRDAQDAGIIKQVPKFPGFKGKDKIKKPNIEWISDADQWRIINHIPREDRPIFLFMKLTGCRPSEARAFRKVDMRQDHIVFAKTFGRGEMLKDVKGKNEEPFPLTEALKELLAEIQKNLTPFVFVYSKTGRPYTKNINRIWNKACDSAGVYRIRLNNAMRHSFGCQMLNAGLDKSVVQRLLRHSDPKMTDRYAEYQTSALKIALDNVVKLPERNQIATKRKIDSITD